MARSCDLKCVAAVAGASFQGEPSVSASSIALTLVIFPWKWDSCSGHVIGVGGKGSRGARCVGGHLSRVKGDVRGDLRLLWLPSEGSILSTIVACLYRQVPLVPVRPQVSLRVSVCRNKSHSVNVRLNFDRPVQIPVPVSRGAQFAPLKRLIRDILASGVCGLKGRRSASSGLLW